MQGLLRELRNNSLPVDTGIQGEILSRRRADTIENFLMWASYNSKPTIKFYLDEEFRLGAWPK